MYTLYAEEVKCKLEILARGGNGIFFLKQKSDETHNIKSLKFKNYE